MDIQLIPVTKKNHDEVLNLKVKENQKSFIETTAQCLKEADELSLWRPTGIYNEGVLIGFTMYGIWKHESERGRVWMDRFLIDEKFQGKGYSETILDLILNRIENEYNCDEIYLSLYEDNCIAQHIYEKCGFHFNDEKDINGEKVMVYKCKASS